jgi:hypothetical protein
VSSAWALPDVLLGARIDALDKGVRGDPEQEEITLESDPRQIPEP